MDFETITIVATNKNNNNPPEESVLIYWDINDPNHPKWEYATDGIFLETLGM